MSNAKKKVLGAVTRQPHKMEEFALPSNIVTIRQTAGKRYGAIISGVRVIADEYASREEGTLGQMTKTVNLEFTGRQVMNFAATGATLASDELEAFQEFLSNNEPVLSEGQDMIVFRGRLTYSSNEARKGQKKLQFRLTGTGNAKTTDLPVNTVNEKGKDVVREDTICLSETKTTGGAVLNAILEDASWLPFLKSHDEGGYVKVESASEVDKTQSEDVSKEINEVEAGVNTPAVAGKEGDIE